MIVCYEGRRGQQGVQVVGAFRSFSVRHGAGRVRFAALASLALFLIGIGSAMAFDYARYEAIDLDALAARKPPDGNGVDVFPVRSVRFDVTLVSPAAPCATGLLKWAMATSGIKKEFIDGVPINQCVQVKTAKGKTLSMFIQDVLVDGLTKEVLPGGRMTLFAGLVYFDQKGPGIIINEFNAEKDCGCGRDFHSGVDFSAPQGTPVSAVSDGVVVRVETDEQADVDTPNAGRCGRYVVLKHTQSNGRTFYSRYAWLGRVVGTSGKPLTVGQRVKVKDKIGEVGSQNRFHFEIRPVDPAGMDSSAKWTQLYGTDPTMEWSKYAVVDPQKFDAAFAGKPSAPANAK